MEVITKLGVFPINIIGKPIKYEGIKIGKIIEANHSTGLVTVKIYPKYHKLLKELINSGLVKSRINKDILLFYPEKRFPKDKGGD